MSGGRMTAGEMLAAVVGDLATTIDAKRPAALADEPDAVHQLRTAVRRLRNVLAAFAENFEPSATGAIRAGLAEHGDRLGAARDLEVRIEWYDRVATEVGVDDGLRERMLRPLRDAHADAHARLATWAGSDEAAALGRSLCSWAAAPPLERRADRPADVVAREVVDAQLERVLAHGRDYAGDEEAAHALRKAGRRLRHVADAVTRPPAAALGDDAARAGRLGSRLQSVLGDHRDALLLAQHVRETLPDDEPARSSYLLVVEAADRAADAAVSLVPDVLAEVAGARPARA